jgi:hypothetical protein
MCPSGGLKQFAVAAIENITRDGLAEPKLLILDEEAPVRSNWKEKARKALRLEGNLWAIENRLRPIPRLPAQRLEPLDSRFARVPRLNCRPELKGKWSQYFSVQDLEQIKSLELDFILKFGFGIIRGEIHRAARYGVWSFHHDDEEKYRGGPPAFWEVAKGDPVSGVLLQRLTDRLDGGIVLKKCYVKTDGRDWARNLQRVYDSSWHLVRLVCLDLHAGDAAYVDAAPSKTAAPIYRAPNDLSMLAYWARIARNRVVSRLVGHRLENWNIGRVRATPDAFLDPQFEPQIEWSPYQITGQFVADPFPIPGTGGARVLVEELAYGSEKGRISEMRASVEGGPLDTIVPLTSNSIHQSYPFVFLADGEAWMIPECRESGRIDLFRLDPRSGEWGFVQTLISGIEAVDATVCQFDGRWWLFHSGAGVPGAWSLYVWHADSLLGPWTPHKGNPVKTDVRSARPAGNFFLHEGRLYRPAQDSSVSYGSALAINQIERLTPTQFRESVVRRVVPDPNGPYPDGLHTLSSADGWCVLDGKKHAWPPLFLLKRVIRKRLRLPKPGFVYPAGVTAGRPKPF